MTILYEKGHAPSRAPRVTVTKFKTRLDKVKDLEAGEPRAHTLHGDELDYDQKVERRGPILDLVSLTPFLLLTGQVCPLVCEGYTSRLRGRKL